MTRAAPRMPASRNRSDWPDAVATRDRRISDLEEALRSIVSAEATLPDTYRNGFTHQVKMIAMQAIERK